MSEPSCRPAIIGSASCYEDLQYLLRLRADQLEVSRETIDELAYFTDGYASKVLAAKPVRRIGWVLMGDLLRVLGVKLVVMEDAKALNRTLTKGRKRIKRQVRNGTMMHPGLQRWFSKHQANCGKNSRRYMTKEQAQILARNAAQIRWAARPGDESEMVANV